MSINECIIYLTWYFHSYPQFFKIPFFPLVSIFAIFFFRRAKPYIVRHFTGKHLPTSIVACTGQMKIYGKKTSVCSIYYKKKHELSFLYLRIRNKNIQSPELIYFYLTAAFFTYPRVFWKTENKIPYCSWYRFVFPFRKISVR